MSLLEQLKTAPLVHVQQRRELAELFGFETRNKYEIMNAQGQSIGFCAEQQKGLLGFLFRQFLGHWRSFELHFFDQNRRVEMTATHPFRWFFQALHVKGPTGKDIGSIERRFAIFAKHFDVHDEFGRLKFEMRSGFLSFWTFPFTDARGREVAVLRKRWSGGLKEFFTDADNFQIEFQSPDLSAEERLLILASAIYVDLLYFEAKGNGGGIRFFED